MVSQGPHDRRPIATKHRKHLLLLVRGEDMGKGVIPLDPMADQQVNDLMSLPMLEMEAAFFTAGLDKIPEITKAEKEMEEFTDPEDVFTLFHLNRPFSAMHLLYPSSQSTKLKVATTKEARSPGVKELPAKEDTGPAEPHTVTSRGRRVVAPERLGI